MIVAFPQDGPGPQQRTGGYYQTVEEIEAAADKLSFDVVVPPRCRHGYYMVPAALQKLKEIESNEDH